MEKENRINELADKIYEAVERGMDVWADDDDFDGAMLEIDPATKDVRLLRENDCSEETADQYSLMDILVFDTDGNAKPDREAILSIASDYAD